VSSDSKYLLRGPWREPDRPLSGTHRSSPIGDTQIVAYRRQRQRHKDKDTKTKTQRQQI